MQVKKITLLKLRKPEDNVNRELQFLGNSLGLFSLRDKERSMFRLFIELVKRKGKIISSDELAYQLNLTRGTVVHHLNKLIISDIVKKAGKGYCLKEENLSAVIKNIKEETCSILEDLEETAKKLDKKI